MAPARSPGANTRNHILGSDLSKLPFSLWGWPRFYQRQPCIFGSGTPKKAEKPAKNQKRHGYFCAQLDKNLPVQTQDFADFRRKTTLLEAKLHGGR